MGEEKRKGVGSGEGGVEDFVIIMQNRKQQSNL